MYSHPADAIPVIDSNTGEVLTIDYPPTNAASAADPHPPSSAAAYENAPARPRFAPPTQTHNYTHECVGPNSCVLERCPRR